MADSLPSIIRCQVAEDAWLGCCWMRDESFVSLCAKRTSIAVSGVRSARSGVSMCCHYCQICQPYMSAMNCNKDLKVSTGTAWRRSIHNENERYVRSYGSDWLLQPLCKEPLLKPEPARDHYSNAVTAASSIFPLTDAVVGGSQDIQHGGALIVYQES